MEYYGAIEGYDGATTSVGRTAPYSRGSQARFLHTLCNCHAGTMPCERTRVRVVLMHLFRRWLDRAGQ